MNLGRLLYEPSCRLRDPKIIPGAHAAVSVA